MAISLQHHMVFDISATFRLHPCPILTTCSSVEALDFSGISRRKGCSENEFTADYKPINRGVPQWTVLDPIRCFPVIVRLVQFSDD